MARSGLFDSEVRARQSRPVRRSSPRKNLFRPTLVRLEDRLARGLATVINILDPDVIVIGGGLSQASHLYESVPKRLGKYVLGGEADTPLVQAKFGDSSGVRGAAWLWPADR